MKTIAFCFFFYMVPTWSFEQPVRYPVAAPYIGLAAYSKQFADVFAFTSNQAALPDLPKFSAGVYGEKRFLLKELNLFCMAAVINARPGVLGVFARHFGGMDFNESQLGLAYGKNMGSVNIGIQFNYHHFGITGSPDRGAITFEMGAIWHVTDRIHTGLHIFNPVGIGFGNNNKEEKLAASYKAGFGFEASGQVYFSMEINKEDGRAANMATGLQYQFAGRFFARIGISTSASQPFIGAGWSWNNIRIDITCSHHSSLGWSPGLMLLYSLKKPDAE